MNIHEKNLTLKLCNYIDPDVKSLAEMIPKHATPAVLGHLFFNRMQGVAYGTLLENDLLGLVNREFRNSLKNAYTTNIEKNESFFKCLAMLSNILKEHRSKYIMLKGAALCKTYPEGYRTSNDIDLLVRPKNITTIGNVLNKAGFIQGHIKNEKFIEATRSEIIESRITRGETIPYILEVNLPYMKYLEVDINFSLDYKSSKKDILEVFFNKYHSIKINDAEIRVLPDDAFLVHLCCHLYKEATTMPWIRMHRDMTLYKFCDIYTMVSKMSPIDANRFFIFAKKLDMEDLCSCVIVWTSELFDIKNEYIIKYAQHNLLDNKQILNTVFSPKDNKIYKYKESRVIERFFNDDRVNLLEVVSDAEIKYDRT